MQPGPDVEPSLGDMAHQCRIVEALLLKHKQLLAPPHGRRTPPPVVVAAPDTATAEAGGGGDVPLPARSEPVKVKVAPAAKRVVIRVAPSAAVAVAGGGAGGGGSGGGGVSSSAAELRPQMTQTTMPGSYSKQPAAAVPIGSKSLAAVAASYRSRAGPAVAGAAVNVGSSIPGNRGGVDVHDAEQFVTDSEEESDEDFVFGAEAISVDVPLESQRWPSREGSLDPELGSPSLSPRTLLSIEQMDSLRVERGLKGLHNPVLASTAQGFGSPSSSLGSSLPSSLPGSLPSSMPTSPDKSRRSSKEAAGAAAAAYTAYDDADDEEYDELDDRAASNNGRPQRGRFLSRRDSDNEPGTFV